jgi:hypothetical protein
VVEAAEGIHDHPQWKTGLRPALPEAEAARLKLREILKTPLADIPPHPAQVDHFSKVRSSMGWEMGGNDNFGTCGPTSVANSRRVTVTYVPLPTSQAPVLQDVYALYKLCDGNSGFDPDNYQEKYDNGVIMQQMLNQARKNGFGVDKNGAVVKPLAFAEVDVRNDDELEAAISIFGCILCGWDLQQAQQSQTDADPPVWDYVAGSRPWGGHATMEGQFASDVQKTVTWTLEVGTTDAFRRRQLSEAWVVVWPEHLQTVQFQEGVSIVALANTFKELTGDNLPIPIIPPQPDPPQPDNPPSGGTADISFLDPVVAARIKRVAKTDANVAAWMNHHFKMYFNIP